MGNKLFTRASFIAAIAAGVFSLARDARATAFDQQLGDAAHYIIIYQGGNPGSQLSINNFGTTGIWTGDIGIAGHGQLAASGPGTIDGNVNFAAANTGQASVSNTGFTAGHGVNYNVAAVQADMNNLNSISTQFGAVAGTGTSVAINTSSDQTILATSGAALGGSLSGNVLFNVTSVNSGNGQNLFVKGDGSANVIFDVNFAAQFHGNIILTDLTGKHFGDAGYAGLTPNQVLFNMYAGAALVGGDTLDANNNGNAAHPANITEGTFLNPNGAISFVNTRFIGHIYGGDSVNMQIVSGDTITLPPPPNTNVPDGGSTLALLGLGISSLAFLGRKTKAFAKRQ